jgi:hypothetical protein
MPETVSFPNNAVGYMTLPVVHPDEILASMSGLEKLPGGTIIANGVRSRPIRVGEMLALLTGTVAGVGASGQWIARKSTELAVQFVPSASPQAISVDDAHMFAIGDTVTVGANAPDVITGIDYDANTITTIATGGANPTLVNVRVHVDGNGQNATNGIAANRFTPSSISEVAEATWGQVSVYIGGLFKRQFLRGSGDGLDVAAALALGAINQPGGQAATGGTLVRVRAGATSIV